MKKILSSLLLGVICALPLAVSAATAATDFSVSIPDSANPTVVTNTDGSQSRTVHVKGTFNKAVTNTMPEFTTQIYDIGSEVKLSTIKCNGNTNFTVSQSMTGTTTSDAVITCTFTAKTATSFSAGAEFDLGTISYDVTSAATSDNCGFKITVPKSNPSTGLNIPYAVMGGGLLLAGAIYVVTRRHNKLYKI